MSNQELLNRAVKRLSKNKYKAPEWHLEQLINELKTTVISELVNDLNPPLETVGSMVIHTGESITGDLSENTWTFEMLTPLEIMAGKFVIIDQAQFDKRLLPFIKGN